jgi:hypothetical protein
MGGSPSTEPSAANAPRRPVATALLTAILLTALLVTFRPIGDGGSPDVVLLGVAGGVLVGTLWSLLVASLRRRFDGFALVGIGAFLGVVATSGLLVVALALGTLLAGGTTDRPASALLVVPVETIGVLDHLVLATTWTIVLITVGRHLAWPALSAKP